MASRHDNDLLPISFGGIVAFGVAAALVPLRAHTDNTNIALVLAVVVIAAAVAGGSWAGVVSALVAAISFDYYFTQPYQSLKMTDSNDVVTTVLLLVVGLVVGQAAARARRAMGRRRRNVRELRRIPRIAELAASGEAPDDLTLEIGAELIDALSLRACTFEWPPFTHDLPVMGRGGQVEHTREVWIDDGYELPTEGVALEVTAGPDTIGRFVLTPRPGVGVPLEQRLIAIALASQLAVVLARAG